MLEIAHRELEEFVGKNNVNTQGIRVIINGQAIDYKVTRQNFRPPVSQGGRKLQIIFVSALPAQAQVERHFTLEVPQDCGVDDDLLIGSPTPGEIFGARVNEVVPHPTSALQMRLRLWVERVLTYGLQELKEKATQALKQQGY